MLVPQPVTTLGPGATKPALRRALQLPVLMLLVAIGLVILTGKSGWLGVGGAMITGLGARLWANRIFRVGARHGDEALPPTTLPPEPGAKAVQMHPEYLNKSFQQAMDNYLGAVGVWISIAGGMIGGAGPFLLDFVRELIGRH